MPDNKTEVFLLPREVICVQMYEKIGEKPERISLFLLPREVNYKYKKPKNPRYCNNNTLPYTKKFVKRRKVLSKQTILSAQNCDILNFIKKSLLLVREMPKTE